MFFESQFVTQTIPHVNVRCWGVTAFESRNATNTPGSFFLIINVRRRCQALCMDSRHPVYTLNNPTP